MWIVSVRCVRLLRGPKLTFRALSTSSTSSQIDESTGTRLIRDQEQKRQASGIYD